MNALLQELGKLTARGKAVWFAGLFGSVVLLCFGVFGLVTQEKNAHAIPVEFNVDADVGIWPEDDDFSTYFPTNSPSTTENTTQYADTLLPTASASASAEPTKQPVPSPLSSQPSMQTDYPLSEPSQKPSQSPTSLSPTISPTVAPSMSPTDFPTAHPTHVPTSSSPTTAPTRSSRPSMTNIPTQAPLFPPHDEPNQAVASFFNYNISKGSRFGPNSWNNVTVLNSTENYWHEFGFVENECRKGAQSPIDVCTQPVKHCEEFHEFRAKKGDYKISSEAIDTQILPNKLRAVMMRRVGDEPDPPHVDFSGIGYANLDLLNIDIKIPAEHLVCGERYDGEMQYYFFHPVLKKLIAVSWLFEAKSDNLNQHMQLLIDGFQSVYDDNEESCAANATARNLSDTAAGHESSSTTNRARSSSRNRHMKKVREWDPFHSDIQRTIHFWGYRGSLTEPPCSPDSVLWRVMDVPVNISMVQLTQMKNILFNNRDGESCEFTSTHYKGSVARPISKSIRYYKCTRSDYVSDDERDLCGDMGCQLPFGKDLDHYFDPIVYVTGPPSESPTSSPSIISSEYRVIEGDHV